MSILDKAYDGTGDATESISPYLKLCVYGPPGSGKTVFAAHAPKPFIIDTENSTEALDDWPELKRLSKIIKCENVNEIIDCIELCTNSDPFVRDRETVIIDTASETQEMMIQRLLERQVADPNSPRKNEFLAYQSDYRESGERLRRLFIQLRNLDMHVIILSHDVEKYSQSADGSERLIAIRPDMTPKLAKTVKRIVGLQGYLTSREQDNEYVREMRVRHSGIIEAKTRYKYLPTKIENPTFQLILDAKNKEDKEKAK